MAAKALKQTFIYCSPKKKKDGEVNQTVKFKCLRFLMKFGTEISLTSYELKYIYVLIDIKKRNF